MTKCKIVGCEHNSLYPKAEWDAIGKCAIEPLIVAEYVGADYYTERKTSICDNCTDTF